MPGMVTPATIGWNIVRSSCRPRKYHGAFDGFGVWLTSARPSSGARTIAEKTRTTAVIARIAANSTTSRCGQVWTLSWASARVCWIEPDFTTVSRRCVWPPGPVIVGAGAAFTAVAVAVPPADAAAGAAAPASPPPASAALRRRDRSSRCAGTPPLSSVIESPPASPPAAAARGSRSLGRRGLAGASPSPSAGAASALSPSSPVGRPSCLRRSALRLRRCSGISGIDSSSPTTARRGRRPCGLARSGLP